MYISIDRTSEYDMQFALFVARYIKKYYRTYVKYQKLYVIDKYIKKQVCKNKKRKFDVVKAVDYGFNSLKVRQHQNGFIIFIDPIKQVPYYPQYTVEQICKLINFGNIEVDGVNVFSDIFNKVQKGLKRLYNLYLSGVVI